jgi:dipeptidyl aminopeptidase/acylaminoacyl peptidase
VLSPDGHWLAWIEQKEQRARTVIFDVDARSGMQDAKRASPVNAASSVTAPVLLISGGNPNVSPEQARSMASALQKAGKSVTVVDLGQQGLWWQQAPARVKVLQELEKFLAEHLSPTAAGGG